METKANYVLIGAFTVLGLLGLLGFLLWFANYRVDQQYDYYDVYMPEVSGLGIASGVRFAGLPVGQVVDVQISSDERGAVRLRLEVRAGTPVKTDSTATVEPLGVTGLSAVGITAGSSDAPLLTTEDGTVPVIQTGQSILQSIGEQTPEILERLNTVSEQLTQLFGPENQQHVNTILGNLDRSTGNLDQAIADVSAATKTIADVAGEVSALRPQIAGIGDQMEKTLNSADAALTAATGTLDQVRTYVEGDLTAVTTEIRETATRFGTLADRAGGTLDAVDQALTTGQGALTAAERAFIGADRAINEDLGPVIADLRSSLAGIDQVVARLTADLPQIIARVNAAAESARVAFASIAQTAESVRAPVTRFASDGLPQITQAARDIRDLARSTQQLVRNLQRIVR